MVLATRAAGGCLMRLLAPVMLRVGLAALWSLPKAGARTCELPHQRGLQSLAHRCREQKAMHATGVMSVHRVLSARPVLLLRCAFLGGSRVGENRVDSGERMIVSLLGTLELKILEHLCCNGKISTLRSC